MDFLTRRAVAAQIAMTAFVTGVVDRAGRDRGQGSIEYVGVILVAAAIVMALIAAAATTNIDETIIKKIETAVTNLK
jgi:hypothetical protein